MSFDFYSVYDELNPRDDDYRFYVRLAIQLESKSVIDLGCGTGALAQLLAESGRRVVGIDPDPEMLRVARSKNASDRIEWRLGCSDCAETESADLFVMSGHVAQVFLGDSDWQHVLEDAHRALRFGGVVAFESRNPSAEAWKRWSRDQTLRVVKSGDDETEFWHETVDVHLPLVTYNTWTANSTAGTQKYSADTLAFRAQSALEASLVDAGFEVSDCLGYWDGSRVDAKSPELIMIATKRRATSA